MFLAGRLFMLWPCEARCSDTCWVQEQQPLSVTDFCRAVHQPGAAAVHRVCVDQAAVHRGCGHGRSRQHDLPGHLLHQIQVCAPP